MSERQQTPDRRDSVLLLHDVPDRGAHVDWMIAPAQPSSVDDRVLVTWRLEEATGRALRDADASLEVFEAVRIADHRYRYLEYEGEVSGGRGNVRRLGRGAVRIGRNSVARWEATVEFASALVLEGDRIGDAPDPEDAGDAPLGLWRFRVVTPSTTGG